MAGSLADDRSCDILLHREVHVIIKDQVGYMHKKTLLLVEVYQIKLQTRPDEGLVVT